MGGIPCREEKRNRANWHLTEVGCSWSVGLTEMEPGFYPPDHDSTCDCIVAPGEYVEAHPEVRRSGLVDETIRIAIQDWWQEKDLDELEDRYHSWLMDAVYEVSQEDLERYAKLDALGKVAQTIMDIVFDSEVGRSFDIVSKWEVLVSVIDQSDLTSSQKQSLIKILEAIREDTRLLEPLFERGFTPELARRTGAKGDAKLSEVSRLHLPGALGFILDEPAYKRLYPNKRAQGFMIRVFHDRDLLGKMFIVNGSDQAPVTIRHEYAHVLFAGYLQTQEQAFSKGRVGGFKDPDAQEIYLQMKDELVAYAAGGEYMIREESLLRGGQESLMERLQYVRDEQEAERLRASWQQVKDELMECQQQGIPAKELFTIFLSSDSFEMIRKRLFLARERRVHT